MIPFVDRDHAQAFRFALRSDGGDVFLVIRNGRELILLAIHEQGL